MENYRCDAHCHIFTLRFALKEAKNILHDILHGTYPFHKPSALTKAVGIDWKSIAELLRQLYELIHAAGGSEEANLDFLQAEAKKAYPDDGYLIVPLMMDIFYMLAYPLNKDEDIRVSKAIKAGVVDETEFQNYWDLILDDFRGYLQSKEPAQKGEMAAAVDEKALNAIKLIEEERSVAGALKVRSIKSGPSDDQGYYPTDGFCYHFDNLMDLVRKRRGELFPFIAIDPRRPGMIKALLNGEFFKGDSRFYGVKLYPRMGFHPQCKPMDEVYKFCSENKIPVIFHSGMGGFPPSTTWKYSDFGNPVHFEPVVKKYPDLKIDFAHLGSSDDTHEWAKKIIQLINENENVYSDLSCYTDIDDLKRVKTYWDDYLKLRERLMFGTDFDVMYFTGRITMQKYYDNFKSVFSADEIKLLMTENPTRFFG